MPATRWPPPRAPTIRPSGGQPRPPSGSASCRASRSRCAGPIDRRSSRRSPTRATGRGGAGRLASGRGGRAAGDHGAQREQAEPTGRNGHRVSPGMARGEAGVNANGCATGMSRTGLDGYHRSGRGVGRGRRALMRMPDVLSRAPRQLEWLKRPLPLAITLLVAAAVGLGGATLAGAFSGSGVPGLVGSGHASGTAAPLPAVSLTLTPANTASGVRPDAHAKVIASGGTIRSVRVTGPDGKPLDGKFAEGHRSWTSTAVLSLGSRYRMSVVGVNPSGVVTRRTSSFTTLEPAALLNASVMPLDGETVGVGMPIAIFFSQPVSNRAAVERRLHVTTSGQVDGAWRWFNDKEVHYRPRAYWPSGTKVTLDVDLNGVDAGNGVWGQRDREIAFTIGQRHVSVVNVNSHKMTVTSGSKTVKVFPMSAGRPKYPTTNGLHFTLEKAKTVTMDSATVGIPRDSPDGYYEQVHWNVRISNTGEFVHAAPWSVGSQGSANVSHGCVNLSVANATWFYNFSQLGDIVQVVGSPKQPNDWALGVVDWNVPWSQWLSGSALH